MSDTVYFIAFPYLALFAALGGGLYRYYKHRFTYSSVSSQLLENRMLFWGSVPWHYGIILILLAHIVPLVATPFWIWLHADPTRILLLEVIGSAMGFLAILGMAALILRRLFSLKPRHATSIMDWVLLIDLAFQIALGFYITLYYRWGSSWYLFTATPWIRSLAALNPRVDFVNELPPVVQLHFVNGFLVIALIPFTRLGHLFTVPVTYLWRPFQVFIWSRKKNGYNETGGIYGK